MEADKVVLSTTKAGLEPLHFLKSTDPPLWLAPSPSLSKAARLASQNLFSILKPFSPKSPFDHLLVDGFDAEQIWQQIDLQSQPLLATVRRDLKQFEKNPEAISNLKVALEDKKKVIQEMAKGLGEESDDFEEDIKEFDEDEDEEEDEEEEGEENREEEDDADIEEGENEESSEEDEGKEGSGGIEDGFLKIKELEEFMEEDEVREYGLQKKDGKKEKKQGKKEEESEDDEDEEDDELGEFDLHDEEDEDTSKLEKARYEDFFASKKKTPGRRKTKLTDGSESELSNSDNEAHEEQKSENLSTHQKQLKTLQSEIEMMEKANLEPKTWTMQGEVTATKRPKNSALEVDLDFEHNMRPAPVITEEVTATLEEIIQKRILEGRFDEVQKAPKRPTKAPREIKDLDENKSKKGLGELYEEEYVEKTNLATAPSSFSDETKKEASVLFVKLCSKLDALSHYHYAPKPVIEDMSISVNVPALAMEEIAPVAVSDAAMLAPEEVFTGKGDIKEAAELTQSDRKRKRAGKKRRYKAMVAKRDSKKAKNITVPNPNEGQ